MNLFDLAMAKKMFGGSGGGAGGDSGWNGTFNQTEECEVGYNSFTKASYIFAVDLPKCRQIGSSAFANTPNLKTVKVGYRLDKQLSVNQKAFMGCTSLQSVDLDACHLVASHAFANCESLEAVEIGYPVSQSGEIENTTIGNSVFLNCSKLKTVKIDRCGSVGMEAFFNCISLEKIKLERCENLYSQAFALCSNLDALILPRTGTICNIDITALFGTKIVTEEGMPTGEGFVYVPTALLEDYVADITAKAMALAGLDEATAEYIARAIFRKIEDYPEICG